MKALLTSLALSILSLPAMAGVDIQHWTTSRGTRVLFVENHNLPILDVQVDFAAGSAFDPPGKSGVASMTHALLDSGANSGHRQLDENAIADRFADIGAQLGGSLDDDRASLNLRVLSHRDKRDKALALMRDILARPGFPQTVFARERERAIASLREARTKPARILTEHFTPALYGGHAYGRISDETSLRRVARPDLVDFHRRYYTARNALITLVGDVSRTEAEIIAAALVADLPTGDIPAPLAAPSAPASRVIRVDHASTQAHVAIGTTAPRRNDPDQMALAVGNYTLGGGGFNSRLMKEIRDARGLAYGASSYFDPMAYGGMFGIQLETRADQAEEAVKVAQETLRGFLRDGPSEAELATAKASLINSFALHLDSNAKLLAQVADIGFYRRPLDALDTYAARVEAVTLDDIRTAFARHVQPAHLVTVIVGGK